MTANPNSAETDPQASEQEALVEAVAAILNTALHSRQDEAAISTTEWSVLLARALLPILTARKAAAYERGRREGARGCGKGGENDAARRL